MEAVFLGYVVTVFLMFAGAAAWPRLRWVLLSLGVLGLVLPVAALVLFAYALAPSNMHFG
jgi:hypothetical protein